MMVRVALLFVCRRSATLANMSKRWVFILVFMVIIGYRNWAVNTCNWKVTMHVGTSDIVQYLNYSIGLSL
jgi:hypothetical protein